MSNQNMPYWSSNNYLSTALAQENILNNLQHQSINKNITDTGSNIVSQITATDKDLNMGICKITDVVGAQSLGVRDAIERTGTNLATNMTTMGQYQSNANRDIQSAIERVGQVGTNTTERNSSQITQSVERNGGDSRLAVERVGYQNTHSTERNASQILQSVERNAGETRLAQAISDAATRQATNDLARDIIQQGNRNTNETLASITLNGTAGVTATTASGFELRNLVTVGTAGLQNALCDVKGDLALQAANNYAATLLEQQKVKEHLAFQNSTNYASLLLEQQKVKEGISAQSATYYASNILEQQKVKEGITYQAANNFSALLLEQQKVKEFLSTQLADSKYEALKNKEALSAQIAAAACDNKYEALKNTQTLSSQFAECCCELKGSIKDSTRSIDDIITNIDTQKLRDGLNNANNEVNLLKLYAFTHQQQPGFYPGCNGFPEVPRRDRV